jgi:hypothetical protein
MSIQSGSNFQTARHERRSHGTPTQWPRGLAAEPRIRPWRARVAVQGRVSQSRNPTPGAIRGHNSSRRRMGRAAAEHVSQPDRDAARCRQCTGNKAVFSSSHTQTSQPCACARLHNCIRSVLVEGAAACETPFRLQWTHSERQPRLLFLLLQIDLLSSSARKRSHVLMAA